MKLLIITHWFDPEPEPRAIRWKAIVEYFLHNDHKIDIIVPQKKGITRNKKERYNIIEVEDNFLLRLAKRTRINREKSEVKIPGSETGRISIVNYARRLIIKMFSQLLWPDQTVLWVFSAFRIARFCIRQKKYDCVITVGLPITPHIVGMLCKLFYSKMLWIAEYGDPFHNNPGLNCGQKFLNRYDREIERWILKRVNILSLPVSEMKALYDKLLPGKVKSIVVIPQFYAPPNESIIAEFENKINLEPGNIHFVFAGRLYKKIRNPLILFNALQILQKRRIQQPIILHIIGNVEEVTEEVNTFQKAYKKVCIYGMMPREYCLAFYSKAHATCNILNASAVQVPSKINDCIMFSNFMLSFNHDAVKPLDYNTFCASIRYDTAESTADAIEKIIPYVITHQFDKIDRPEIITVNQVGTKFEAFIKGK